MKKKLFALLCAVSLIIGTLPAAVLAAADDIVILFESDVHCAVDGYTKIAALRDEALAETDYVSVVSCGDFIQGGPLGSVSNGGYIIDIMNAVGYDAVTLGNHEFDYSIPTLAELTDELTAKTVSCNFVTTADGATLYDPYTIISYGDTDVAFIGITTPESITKSTPTYFMDDEGNYIYGFCADTLYDTVQASIDAALDDGADYVVALSHLGTEYVTEEWTAQEVAAHTVGLDVMLDGHSHSVIESTTTPDANGDDVLISSVGTKFQYIGKLTIDADGEMTTELIDTTTYEGENAEVSAVVAAIEAEYAELGDRVVGASSVTLTTLDENGVRAVRNAETNIGDFCADAFRAELAADIGVMNGGGIRADIEPGDVTFNDILAMFPYENLVYSAAVTGQDILDMLELSVMYCPEESGGFLQVSGVTFDVRTDIPSSVTLDENGMFISVDGTRRVSNVKVLNSDTGEYEAIDADAEYTIASIEYILKENGNGYTMFNGAEILSAGDLDTDIIEDYIDTLGGTIPEEYASVQSRINLVDAAIGECVFDAAGNLNVTLENAAGATLILCAYTSDGTLENIRIYTVGDDSTVDTSDYIKPASGKVKAFLWDSTDGMVPIDEVTVPSSEAIAPNVLAENRVEQNAYMPDTESILHNDIYSSDVTNKCMPLGIYTEVFEGTTDISPNSPPAFFYDLNGNAVAPYSITTAQATIAGGIAIMDMDSDNLEVKGSFLPALNDSAYGIQISYSFVDAENNFVGPATNGHVVMLKTYDEDGNILELFEKILDVDVVTPAKAALGDDIDTNLMSIVYDYDGNLWFVTGGFHKNPAYSSTGFTGYLEREYIDAVLAGDDTLNAEDYLHFYRFANSGENCENAIAANVYGCVILTNLNCYTFSASDEGVKENWSVGYESSGGKGPIEDSTLTGCGLAWGGGSSPTLTNELVLFTDNLDVVNLYAVDAATGAVVATTPVLDIGTTVSVENSICVYSGDDTRTSVLVCNWYGAGNAGLFDPTSDSSVQSYDNIYDSNWRANGNSCIMPGVERVDVVKGDDGSYSCETVWTRADLRDTSMIKLSTGAGYYYGYVQDIDTGYWGFIALDYDTGETVFWQPVSNEAQYNNIAVGIMQGDNGNSVYCPTDSATLLRISDRFAYLATDPDKELDITSMRRARYSGDNATSYVLSATVEDAAEDDILALRVNGLTGTADGLTLCYKNAAGEFTQAESFTLCSEDGTELDADTVLDAGTIYEIRVSAADGGIMDNNADAGITEISVVLLYNE